MDHADLYSIGNRMNLCGCKTDRNTFLLGNSIIRLSLKFDRLNALKEILRQFVFCEWYIPYAGNLDIILRSAVRQGSGFQPSLVIPCYLSVCGIPSGCILPFV